jgi:UDP-GlcNAc:undecaprenyl-phosphate GlcNAc-1-phosphate transferase
VVLAVPIFDTTLVTVLRKSHGLGAMQGGRDHISHRLVRLGLSERGAVLALYGLGALGGLIGLALTVRPNWAIVGVGFYGLLLALLGIRLAAVPVYADAAVRSPVRVRLQQFIETVLIRWHLPALAVDIFLIGSAYYLAFIFRYEAQFVGAPVALYVQTLPLVIPLLLLWFLATGVYRPVWRALSIFDLKRYLLTFSLIPPFLIGGYLLLGYRFSVTMVLIFTLLLGILVIGSRLFFRLVDQLVNERVNAGGSGTGNVLIYGAGNASRIAAEELLRDPSRGLRIVGLVDDDATLHGRKLWGHTVLGGGADLAALVAAHRVKEIIVSSSKIDALRVAQGVQALPEPPAVSRMTVAFQRVGPARGGAEAPGDAPGPEAGADDGDDTPTSPAARSTGR